MTNRTFLDTIATIIDRAEADLKRQIEPGEYVDLLMDNTNLMSDLCRVLAINFCIARQRYSDALLLIEFAKSQRDE